MLFICCYSLTWTAHHTIILSLYKGQLQISINGNPCKNWNQIIYSGKVISKTLLVGNHNYCRNPNGMELAPFCIINDEGGMEYCFSSPGCEMCDGATDADESCETDMAPFCSLGSLTQKAANAQAWEECPATCCKVVGCNV